MQIRKYVIGIYATNCYLVTDEVNNKCFIVDPAGPEPAIKDLIEKEGLSLEYMILTHGHFDHTGGIDFFKESFPDCKLVASRAERSFLFERKQSMGKGGIKADIEVRDGDTLTVGDINMRFIDTPGHTPGGMCVYIESEGVLFSGDTLFHASVGRTDLPGGDWDKLRASIADKLFALPDDVHVLPGHDAETMIGYEKRYNPFV